MKATFPPLSLCLLFLPSCAAHPPEPLLTTSPVHTLELQHQILFENGDEQQVFEGTMIQAGNSFLVRAFAGPGIDLFTVVRTPKTSTQQAHVPGLAQRIDMREVGDDIGRVYRSGCPGPASSTTTCPSEGETLEETRDGSGELIRRSYPQAHGAGLSILYEQREPLCGTSIPRRITLTWGQGKSRMVIFTADCKVRRDAPPELSR
ncbi:MAG: hypothetical protein MUC50_15725 [Myxococcota bacterium]|nr:hypothetical protein [Myxococcota bacterium]